MRAPVYHRVTGRLGVTPYEKDVTTRRKGPGNNGVGPLSAPVTPSGSLMPTVSFENLRACLDLTEAEPGRYVGANLELDYHRVFGGQILAQTIVAATNAADGGKQVKSLTQLFPREANSALPMSYAVTKHQEGRTFGSTGVVASQTDETGKTKPVSVATLSMHAPEEGLV